MWPFPIFGCFGPDLRSLDAVPDGGEKERSGCLKHLAGTVAQNLVQSRSHFFYWTSLIYHDRLLHKRILQFGFFVACHNKPKGTLFLCNHQSTTLGYTSLWDTRNHDPPGEKPVQPVEWTYDDDYAQLPFADEWVQ